MWINKNAYLYEKNLDKDRIVELEKQVRSLEESTAEEVPKQDSVNPPDAYVTRSLQNEQLAGLAQSQAHRGNLSMQRGQSLGQQFGVPSGCRPVFGSVFGG